MMCSLVVNREILCNLIFIYMKKHNIQHRPSSTASARSVDVAALSRALADLPMVPLTARPHTRRSLIAQLREPLVDALVNRHYSFAALAEVLGQRGIDIRPDTLRRYLGPVALNQRVSPRGIPPVDRSPVERPLVGESSPAPKAASLGGSPHTLARRDTAGAETPPKPSVQLLGGSVDEPPADSSVAAPGTFTPRPERPIDWYKPSS